MDRVSSAGFLRRLSAAIPITASALLLSSGTAFAQGGPPMVTDDPDTPGDGRWEINLAVIDAETAHRREISAPDADINYGWGDHVQLMMDIPWVAVHDSGEAWKSGLGAPAVGLKWRMVDIEDSGYSLSTFPQLRRNWLSSSLRRGITDTGQEFFLPLEASTKAGKFAFDGEVGRNYIQNGLHQWESGVIAAHPCGDDGDCMLEIHRRFAPGDSQTLINFGLHWKLSQSLAFIAAAGREFGPRSDDRQSALVYIGIQLLR